MVDIGKTYYVYSHTRVDKNEIFYIGLSYQKEYKRAYEKVGRNEIWKYITKKTDFIVNILSDNLSFKEACKLEIELIAKYKRIRDGGTLANITLGGEGHLGICGEEHHMWGKRGKDCHLFGLKRTDEQKQRMSIAQKKRPKEKNPMWGKKMSDFTRRRIREANLGRKNSETTKQKMRSFPNKNAHLKKKIINIKTSKIYNSLKEAAKDIGVTPSTLCFHLKHKYNKHNVKYL